VCGLFLGGFVFLVVEGLWGRDVCEDSCSSLIAGSGVFVVLGVWFWLGVVVGAVGGVFLFCWFRFCFGGWWGGLGAPPPRVFLGCFVRASPF